MIRQGLVLLIVVATTILGWRLLDRQIDAATVEGPLHGVTYAPWAKDQDPIDAKASGIFSFLRTAVSDDAAPSRSSRARNRSSATSPCSAGKVDYVRTYRTTDGGDVHAGDRRQVGLKLVPGAWIYSANEAKLQFGREAERGQCRGDARADPHGQPEPQHRAGAGRQREHPALGRPEGSARSQRDQPGPAHPRDPERQAQRQGAGQHRRAVARLAELPRARAARSTISPSTSCPTGTSSRDETAARLSQEPDRHAEAGLSEQEHHRHRGRLAVERRRAAQPRRPAWSSTPRPPSRPRTFATWSRG